MLYSVQCPSACHNMELYRIMEVRLAPLDRHRTIKDRTIQKSSRMVGLRMWLLDGHRPTNPAAIRCTSDREVSIDVYVIMLMPSGQGPVDLAMGSP